MRTRGAILCVFLALAVSCGGGDPTSKLMSHNSAMTDIIRRNMDNPDECLKQMRSYVTAHKAEMERLAAEMQKLMQKDPSGMQKKMSAFAAQVTENYKVKEEFERKHPEKAEEFSREFEME